MIIKRKTQIILALLITSVFLFQNCALISRGTSERRFPKRKQGTIVITKKDGQQIEGELIAVKPNSLLLLDAEGKDVSIDIADIKVIRIVKKSKALSFARIGGGIGVLVGLIMNIEIISWNGAVDDSEGSKTALGAIVGGFIGALIGGMFGEIAGKDKTIQIEGMTDSEIKEAMRKMRKKARIRDYK